MIEEVLPNIYRIEVPLPRNPLKSVNSYLLVSPERNLVIDTAFNQPECLEVLKQAYDELKLDLDRTDFFATHLHGDYTLTCLEIALTLPGHRTMIPDCRKRVAELKEHHRNRCNEVIDILKNGSCHAVQTASQMTWDIREASWDAFPLMQQWFATGEALAHLRFLENKGFVSQ